MSPRPGERIVRAVVSVTMCAALASAPLWGVQPARAVTPEQAMEAGYIPNPAPALARITIDDITPRVLDGADAGEQRAVGTEAGVPTVTVSGTIRNVGDVQLESVDVRLQRGPRAADAESVRAPLVWSEPSFSVQGEFSRLALTLAPGESVPYRVSMPAREVPGSPGPDLQLTEPGVYPLLVNVNGTPEGGSPARLDDARTLLPVMEVPPPASPPGGDDDEVGANVPADEPGPAPVPLTVLWPLAAAPTRIALVPGEDGPEPVVALTDDSLLRDLSEEGRLTGLVRAAASTFDGTGGEELRRATCLAVDPDLLNTVAELADGRAAVIDDGSGPEDRGDRERGDRDRAFDGAERAPVDESVTADASRWLDQLRALADGTCVMALPAAQADLSMVSAIGDTTLTSAALNRDDTVERILDVAPAPDVLVPAAGTLDPATAQQLLGAGSTAAGSTTAGSTAIVAAPSTRTDTGLVPPAGLVGLAGPDQPGRVLTYSATVGASLAATGEVPENPLYSDPTTRYWLTADSPAARAQDARAALLAPVIDAAYAAALAPDPAPGDTPTTEPGVLAVPPQVWTIDEESAGSLLGSLSAQISAGRMRAVPLQERLGGPVTIPDGSLVDDPTGAVDPGAVGPDAAEPGEADSFPDDTAEVLVQRLSSALDGIDVLRSLVDTSDPTSADASAHIDPIVGDVLRVISETGRRAGGDGLTRASGTGEAARVRTTARLDRLEETVSASLARVDLLTPGSVFTMASPNSPLMLVTRNALPFPVRVNVTVTAPPDIQVDPVGLIQIPAAGSRTLQVPTQSDSDGGARHTVSFALHGPGGTPLSEPVELSVQSGGYPVAQGFAIAAAALALVLGGRRYLRYRRGILDPADEGHRP